MQHYHNEVSIDNNIVRVRVNASSYTTVDLEDWDRVRQYTWRALS
jgi:hypothetical protein